MKEALKSRLSSTPLAGAKIILDLPSAPLPGLYLDSAEEAASLRAPLKVVQADDGLVQLAFHLPSEVYEKYGFAGGQSTGYRRYLSWFAVQVKDSFPADASIFEIGCGDGTLLDELRICGFQDVAGIDPSPQAELGEPGQPPRFRGYFPQDLPASHASRSYDVIICRHVLEHIETPDSFIRSAVAHLNENGDLWIEVPDLVSTVKLRWWTNFYALHCNYFEEVTLDALLARHGFHCVKGQVVEIFGGSILRRYRKGASTQEKPGEWANVRNESQKWQQSLQQRAACLPEGTWGWGAAERTASALAFCPSLEKKLAGLVDGNHQLHGKWMAGTQLQVHPVSRLQEKAPPAVVVFALSYADEIITHLKSLLPVGTPILIPGDPVTLTEL